MPLPPELESLVDAHSINMALPLELSSRRMDTVAASEGEIAGGAVALLPRAR